MFFSSILQYMTFAIFGFMLAAAVGIAFTAYEPQVCYYNEPLYLYLYHCSKAHISGSCHIFMSEKITFRKSRNILFANQSVLTPTPWSIEGRCLQIMSCATLFSLSRKTELIMHLNDNDQVFHFQFEDEINIGSQDPVKERTSLNFFMKILMILSLCVAAFQVTLRWL